jgi:hypothetical protein
MLFKLARMKLIRFGKKKIKNAMKMAGGGRG